MLSAAHSTRINVTMHSGKIWEIVLRTGSKPAFRLFQRTDTGYTGSIPWSDAFIEALTAQVQSRAADPVDLAREHRATIMAGSAKRKVSDAARKQLGRFPGYPEMLWNRETQKFEYAN